MIGGYCLRNREDGIAQSFSIVENCSQLFKAILMRPIENRIRPRAKKKEAVVSHSETISAKNVSLPDS